MAASFCQNGIVERIMYNQLKSLVGDGSGGMETWEKVLLLKDSWPDVQKEDLRFKDVFPRVWGLFIYWAGHFLGFDFTELQSVKEIVHISCDSCSCEAACLCKKDEPPLQVTVQRELRGIPRG